MTTLISLTAVASAYAAGYTLWLNGQLHNAEGPVPSPSPTEGDDEGDDPEAGMAALSEQASDE